MPTVNIAVSKLAKRDKITSLLKATQIYQQLIKHNFPTISQLPETRYFVKQIQRH